MNRFTNKNGGILPFQMIKLAAGVNRQTQETIINIGTAGVEALKKAIQPINAHTTAKANQVLGAVGEVGKGVDGAATAASKAEAAAMEAAKYSRGAGKALTGLHGKADAALKKMDELLNSGGKASDAELMAIRKQLQEGLEEISAAYKAGDAAAAARFNQLMDMNKQLAAKLPGRWSRIISGTALAGGASGLTIAGDRLLTGDANAAHAAGAGDEGDLAGEQAGKGSWWENTWNDINKFREDHPGWFYGGLGVGLLGGGYALSEMLDDDDDEEEENNYNYRRY